MRYLLCVFLACFEGCFNYEEDELYLWIKNMSDYDVATYFALGLEEVGYPTLYPDTSLPVKKVVYNTKQNRYRWVEENLYRNIIGSQMKMKIVWLGPLHGNQLDTLSVFIIHKDTLVKYGYDDVRENYRVIVRYDLAWEDVKKLNYIFPYPPTPDMKDMKMYPAYQEITSQETN